MCKVDRRKVRRPPRRSYGTRHEDLDETILEDWMCAGAPPS
jgi:hypothetical protein